MPARGDAGPTRLPKLRRAGAAATALACLLAAPAAAAPARFPDVAAGQQVVLRKGCANCHGILGPGGRQGPDLFRTARGKGAAELLAAMWNHVPQMVEALTSGERLPSLSAEELRDLVGYLNFVNYLGDLGDAERGGRQVAEMPCLACHDLVRRGRIGPALVDPGRAASAVGLVTDLWNHYPGMRYALRDRGLPWFPWSGEFLADLSRYLNRLLPAGTRPSLMAPGDPRAGAARFERLGCAACHGPAGGASWVALIRRSNRSSAAENGAALLRHLPTIESAAVRGRSAAALRPLSEQAMADLLAFLALAGTELGGGDAVKGRLAFDRQRCGTCHGLPGGERGIGPAVERMPVMADPYEAAARMLQHAWHMKTAAEIRHVPWPRLQADELLDLYAFLTSVRRR